LLGAGAPAGVGHGGMQISGMLLKKICCWLLTQSR
jgi:hypothetical protein